MKYAAIAMVLLVFALGAACYARGGTALLTAGVRAGARGGAALNTALGVGASPPGTAVTARVSGGNGGLPSSADPA